MTNNDRPLAYIASPLFNPHEREFNAKLDRVLSSRFRTFLPQRDGMLLAGKELNQSKFQTLSRIVFDSDTAALIKADLIFAVLDGRAIDEGVAFELGFARALGKPCYGLKTDARTLLPWGDNPMIHGALSRCFYSIDEVMDWISLGDNLLP